ncbi:MAG: DUF1269 domain-containing protein [Gammaproteobacteria bacterium]|jgi:uncharacterized membrane protein
MADLIVIEYDDMYKAEEVRLRLQKMQRDYLVDLEDAVIAVKDQKGKVKLDQIHNVTAQGAISGGFLGTLVGILFLNPLLGLAAGAAAGAISGALTDVGISDKFMKNVASGFKNGSSALFVLVRKVTPDKVRAELEGTGGNILQTSLTHEEEAKLQAALSAVKPTASEV